MTRKEPPVPLSSLFVVTVVTVALITYRRKEGMNI